MNRALHWRVIGNGQIPFVILTLRKVTDWGHVEKIGQREGYVAIWRETHANDDRTSAPYPNIKKIMKNKTKRKETNHIPEQLQFDLK